MLLNSNDNDESWTPEAEALTNACYDYETKLSTRGMSIAAGDGV